MNLRIPKKLVRSSGALITISGIVNIILGVQIGAVLYEAYPGGNMGHVGIIAGIAAIIIGLVIFFGIVRLYDSKNRWIILLGGILTIVIGHIGGIAGAIYVGTLGVLLCYISGMWIIVVCVKGLVKKNPS